MTNRFQYGVEKKRQQLEAEGRRCDGNSRSCPVRATEIHRIIRADGHGNVIPGAVVETRQTCSNHRRQYKYCDNWKFLGSTRLPDSRPLRVTFSSGKEAVA